MEAVRPPSIYTSGLDGIEHGLVVAAAAALEAFAFRTDPEAGPTIAFALAMAGDRASAFSTLRVAAKAGDYFFGIYYIHHSSISSDPAPSGPMAVRGLFLLLSEMAALRLCGWGG